MQKKTSESTMTVPIPDHKELKPERVNLLFANRGSGEKNSNRLKSPTPEKLFCQCKNVSIALIDELRNKGMSIEEYYFPSFISTKRQATINHVG